MTTAPTTNTEHAPERPSRWARMLGLLRPSHAHSVFSASILLAASSIISSLVGLGRGKYIAWLFGAGPQTDAYMAAFRLPDLMNNFLVGGAVSITFVTLLNRYKANGEEAEGERLLFTVLNMMVLVLTVASLVLMFFAAPFIRWINPGFTAEQVALSAQMTRILLPAQIFLFAGSLLGALLLVRKQFLYQAATPILYNLFIIAGGVFLHRRFGISSLTIGATVGFLFGSLAINAWGVARARIPYRWQIDLQHPGLKAWFHMTLPLMVGFTLPFLDQYFSGYYASHGAGDITRLANAKQLFSAPMTMLAQAAGAASMPFFAQLWAKKQRYEFAVGVADSVSRVVSLGFLAASLMIALAQPIVGVLFGGGRFTQSDVHTTALFFIFYTLSLFAWSAQAIYARAFYAAGITWLPMAASVIILVVAFPLYGLGYRWMGSGGLAIASDLGLILQAATLALLLHQRHMVSLAGLDYEEMGRCLLTALATGAALWAVVGPGWTWASHALGMGAHAAHNRWIEVALLLMGSALWLFITNFMLAKTGSALPHVVRKRLKLA
ncbi:MAG TPA: lipid II flippase MurJ [Terracidiphilus sp.]|nr:lipid II flippase MurJ [Terracidiphilus sp.]